MKPIRVWMAPAGPNPWKVILILEELNVPYEIVLFEFSELKSKPFTDMNPNGRAPAIEDPTHDLTLWESGAIVQYLIEQYDVDNTLTYSALAQRHKLQQWLYFQVSGQGPYFGQAGWFNVMHSEKIPSAIERYNNEVKRVLQVLDDWLRDSEHQWLVGDKMTFADLAFVPWNDRVDATIMIPRDVDKFHGYPFVKAWHERMISRPAWKRAMEKREIFMNKQGLQWHGMPEGVENMEQYMHKIKLEQKNKLEGAQESLAAQTLAE